MSDTDGGHGGMTLQERIEAAGIDLEADGDGTGAGDAPEGTGTGDGAAFDAGDHAGEPAAESEGDLEWTDGRLEEDGEEPAPQTRTEARGEGEERSVSRLVRNVAVKERELAAERQARRQEQAELNRLRAEVGRLSQRPQDADDPVELLRGWAVRRLGLTQAQANDPRVLAALQEAAVDLTAEAYEQSDADPSLRERRAARQRRREEAARFGSYEQRIAAMEAERARAEEAAVVAEVRSDAVQYLSANSARTPHLSAAVEAGDIDPVALLMESAAAMIESGEAPQPRNRAEVGRLYGLVLANAERHYAGLAQRLAAKAAPGAPGGKPAPAAGKRRPGIDVRDGGRSAKVSSGDARDPRSRAGGASGNGKASGARSTRGGGGRGSAAPEPIEEPGERLDLEARIRRAERDARRGR